MGKLIQRVLSIGTWHLMLLTLLVAEGVTALVILALSALVWERLSVHMLTTGLFVAGCVSVIVAPVIMHLARLTSRLGMEKEYLEREILVRREADEALSASEKKYRSLVESTDDSVYLVNREFRYLFINRRHIARLSVKADGYMGRHYSEFHSPEETAQFTENAMRVFEGGLPHQYETYSLRDNRHYLLSLSPVLDDRGLVEAVTVVSKDITKRKRMEEELRALSLTDPLTQLHNRRGFMALADQQLRIAYRFGRGVTVIYADLDGLKAINDELGHHHGDLAIMEAGHLIRRTYREADIIARMGGDEFAVLIVESDPGEEGILLGRLARNIELHNATRETPFDLSISAGVARYDGSGAYSIEELLDEADRNMYRMKHLHHGVK